MCKNKDTGKLSRSEKQGRHHKHSLLLIYPESTGAECISPEAARARESPHAWLSVPALWVSYATLGKPLCSLSFLIWQNGNTDGKIKRDDKRDMTTLYTL